MAVVLMMLLTAVVGVQRPGLADAETSRLAGEDRIATAVEISKSAYDDTDHVYLAVADNFPDALAGSALTDNGPILLVPGCGDLPDIVANEIERLTPGRITALGGKNVLCDDILDQAAVDRDTSRLAGEDRIATAVEISKSAYDDTDHVYLAVADNFPDALAGSALTDNGPILLVPGCGDLPDIVANEIERLTPGRITALGGKNVLCDDIVAAAATHVAEATSTLKIGEELAAGDLLRSSNGRYRLTMQSDGNLVLRDGDDVLWASDTDGNAGARTRFQTDGNVVVIDADGEALWATATEETGANRLVMQDDGNLVIYTDDGDPVWDSGTKQPSDPPEGDGTNNVFAQPMDDPTITQKYACQDCVPEYPDDYHTGTDMDRAGPNGDQIEIRSIADGVVVIINEDDGFGKHVVVRHELANDETLYSGYSHLASVDGDLALDDCIGLGTTIGIAGQTGATDAIHLHLTMRDSDVLSPGYSPDHPNGLGFHDPYDFIGEREASNICS